MGAFTSIKYENEHYLSESYNGHFQTDFIKKCNKAVFNFNKFCAEELPKDPCGWMKMQLYIVVLEVSFTLDWGIFCILG